jgi:hypothetical protein
LRAMYGDGIPELEPDADDDAVGDDVA